MFCKRSLAQNPSERVSFRRSLVRRRQRHSDGYGGGSGGGGGYKGRFVRHTNGVWIFFFVRVEETDEIKNLVRPLCTRVGSRVVVRKEGKRRRRCGRRRFLDNQNDGAP